MNDEKFTRVEAFGLVALPCPFCGGSSLMVRTGFVCYVTCDTCDADGPPSRPKSDDGPRNAVEKWNRREPT